MMIKSDHLNIWTNHVWPSRLPWLAVVSGKCPDRPLGHRANYGLASQTRVEKAGS